MFCGLQSAVCGLQSAVCSLRSAVCGLWSAVCGLQSAVCVFTGPPYRVVFSGFSAHSLRCSRPTRCRNSKPSRRCRVYATQAKCSGPSCIKQRKIKWKFLQPFLVFQRIFLHAFVDNSVEGGLKSIRNTMTVGKKIPRKTGHGCRNSH